LYALAVLFVGSLASPPFIEKSCCSVHCATATTNMIKSRTLAMAPGRIRMTNCSRWTSTIAAQSSVRSSWGQRAARPLNFHSTERCCRADDALPESHTKIISIGSDGASPNSTAREPDDSPCVTTRGRTYRQSNRAGGRAATNPTVREPWQKLKEYFVN
jgi:hypothetical protein